jgi:hypothetical protein
MTIYWMKENAFSLFSVDSKLEKIALRTGKEVGRSFSYIHICSVHVFLEAVKSNDLIALTWTWLLGPGFGRGIFGLYLDAAFYS